MTAVAAAVVASFLAACVECVEAFTVILAVGITRSWRSALLGAVAAVGVLAVVIAAFGLTLASRIPLPVLRGAIGAFVLVFGLNWLRKAILRYAGIKGLHDEGELFAEHLAGLREQARAARFDWLGFTVSLKSTLLEGLEVAFIVITFGLSSGKVAESALGALAACLVIGAAGFGLRKPLEKVPENTMKFVVGVMLTSFGTFWAGEGLGVSWPAADLFVVALLAIYLGFSYVAVRALRAARTAGQTRARAGGGAMSWLVRAAAFVYDFLADDGWELLVGLAIMLPLTFLVARRSEALAAAVLLAGVLATLTISLARKVRAVAQRSDAARPPGAGAAVNRSGTSAWDTLR